MTDGNTEGILVNEPKQATTVSNSNPAVNITHIQKIAPDINRKLTPEELASLKQDRADELASRLAMVPKANEMTQPVHDILDIVGAIPVIGVVADVSNGAIYSAEGRVGEAILSYGSAVAGIVQPLGGGAIAKGAKVVKGGTRLIGNGFKRNNNRKTSNNNSTKNNDNKKDGIAVKDEKNKPVNNKECPAVGHPVNPVLGIKFLAGEPECDFTLSSYFPLIWQRRYFSDIAENSWLGQGWTLPFTQHLEKKDDGLHFINEQGSSVKIPPLSPGQCKFDNSSLLYFSREDNNRYRITPAGKKESLIFSPLTIDESDPQGHHATRFPLIGLEDCYGNCIRLIYSSAGLPKSIRTATGQWLTLNFIELNHSDGEMLQRLQRVCLLDENNTVSPLTTYCYSAEGDLCAVRDSSGNTQREFKYTNHILVQQGIPGGVISRYRYNEYTPEGKVMSLYTNLGQTWFFEYNTGSTLVTDPLNRKNCYQFDQNNELTAFTDAKNGTTYYGRDKNGQVNSIIFPDKTETHCTYDRHGNIILITNPAGKKTYIHYDNKSNPISVIDETGKITRYAYDSNSGLKSIIDPLNQTTEYIRDNRGLITEVKDPCGNVYAFLYNSTGLLTGTKDCSGAETRYIRNHTGNIIKTITPDGAVTRLTYTMNGMISTVYHPDGTSDHYHYNSQRQLIGYRNGAGEQTILQLAPDGLLLSKTDPFGRTFSCEYDSARRLTKLKNENNACYTFTYDDNDNLIREQKI